MPAAACQAAAMAFDTAPGLARSASASRSLEVRSQIRPTFICSDITPGSWCKLAPIGHCQLLMMACWGHHRQQYLVDHKPAEVHPSELSATTCSMITELLQIQTSPDVCMEGLILKLDVLDFTRQFYASKFGYDPTQGHVVDNAWPPCATVSRTEASPLHDAGSVNCCAWAMPWQACLFGAFHLKNISLTRAAGFTAGSSASIASSRCFVDYEEHSGHVRLRKCLSDSDIAGLVAWQDGLPRCPVTDMGTASIAGTMGALAPMVPKAVLPCIVR